jgi:hypothetical protein
MKWDYFQLPEQKANPVNQEVYVCCFEDKPIATGWVVMVEAM